MTTSQTFEKGNTEMKLTIEQHREIAAHLHAADHHLLKSLKLMAPGDGTARAPIALIDAIEALRDELGAASSVSRQTIGSITHQCEAILFAEHSGQTFEIYGGYSECVTLPASQIEASEAGH